MISTYLKVAKLADKPSGQQFSGHRFESQFSVGDKVVVLRGTTTGAGSATVAGTAVPDVKVAAVLDKQASQVVLSVDRASLAAAVGARLEAGSVLTGTITRALSATAAGAPSVADTATGATPAASTYRIGDNTCFAPPAAKLTKMGASSAQFGDSVAVAVRLVNAKGTALAGKRVTVNLGSATSTVTTGRDGTARASVPVRMKAGRATLTAAFAGDATAGAVLAATPFTITVERTALRASGENGVVTAALTDDDRRPVAGQVVTFTAGSRKQTARTDGRGTAKATGFEPGSLVNVSYAGVNGQYAPSKTTTEA